MIRNFEDVLMRTAFEGEALKGDRQGQHSIRVNDQFRICFVWSTDGASEVEFTD